MKPLRRCAAVLVVMLLPSVVLASVGAPTAQAHPLGNATVNHYDGLNLYPTRVLDSAVEDIAEIPTLQRKPLIDTDHDGRLSQSEDASYAARQCTAMARSTSITVNGNRVTLVVTRSSYSERPGVIQLTVGRLECDLAGTVTLAGQVTIGVHSGWDSAGIGWHEITATGTGVRLQNSPFPATSISDDLRTYPNDMLSSPLNVRSGSVTAVAGTGNSTYAAAKDLPVAGFAVRQLNKLANEFNRLVGAKHLTVGVGVLAILLAILLGAGHAFLPGHGKTIMAAYLVGRRGRLRDVVLVGATVTITHTAGVLLLGVIISVTAAFSTTAAEQDLGVVSGLIIAAVGTSLLISAVIRSRRQSLSTALVTLQMPNTGGLALLGAAGSAARDSAATDSHSHDLSDQGSAGHDYRARDREGRPNCDQEHPHDYQHDQEHQHDDQHAHPHELDDKAAQAAADDSQALHKHGFLSRPHSHASGPTATSRGPGFSKGGLIGLGVAGGLVPSPSALLVLLAAIALGRTTFGITLVLSYGFGMACALTAAGLILVRLRHRLSRLRQSRRFASVSAIALAMPFLTAALVLVVGIGLTLRAARGIV